MDTIATQLAQLQEQVQALSLLPSVVARLSKENEDQASSISLLQSTNESLSSEVESLKSFVRFHETEAHLRGRFVYDPVGVVVGGVVKGCWRWHSAFYSLTDAALGVGIPPFATLEHLPIEIMNKITSLLPLSDTATLCRVSYRVLELVSSSVYEKVVIQDVEKAMVFVESRGWSVYPLQEPRFQSARLTPLLRPMHLFLPSPLDRTHSYTRYSYGGERIFVVHLHIISDSQFRQDLLYWYRLLPYLDPEFLHIRSSPSSFAFTTAAASSTYPSFSSSLSSTASSILINQLSRWPHLRGVTMSGPGSVLVRDGKFSFGQLLSKSHRNGKREKWEMILRTTRLDTSISREVVVGLEALDGLIRLWFSRLG